MGGVGRGRGRGGAGVSIPSGLGYGRQRGGSSGTLNAMCCKTCAVPLTVSYLLPVSTYIPKVEHGDGRSEEATLSPLGSTETWRFGGKDGTSCVREARGGMMGRGQNAPSWALPRRRVARENRPQVPRSVGRRSKLLPKASATPSPRPGRAHAPAARSLAQACFSSPKTRARTVGLPSRFSLYARKRKQFPTVHKQSSSLAAGAPPVQCLKYLGTRTVLRVGYV